MFFSRSTAKLLMQPGGTHGETNGLYAAVLVNTNRMRPMNLKSQAIVRAHVPQGRRIVMTQPRFVSVKGR